MTARLDLPGDRTPADQVALFSEVTTRLTALPGVRAAGAVTTLPLGGSIGGGFVTFEGRALPPDGRPPAIARLIVTPGYFEALRLPLVEGRHFLPSDTADAPRIAIVNRALARQFSPTRVRWDAGSSEALSKPRFRG